MVTWMSESSCFRTTVSGHSVHEFQTLLKPNFLLISGNLSWKTSVLVRSEILELFFNTFTFYHMYSYQNYEKFAQEVQT